MASASNNHRALVRKLDTRLLRTAAFALTSAAFLALLYLSSFIDRVNIGNAKVADMDKDLHLRANEYKYPHRRWLTD